MVKMTILLLDVICKLMVTKDINDPTRPIKIVCDEVVFQEVDLADDL